MQGRCLVPAAEALSHTQNGPMTVGEAYNGAGSEHLDRLRDLVLLCATPMTVSDPGGRFLLVNQSFADLVGRPVPVLLTLHFQDITHPDDNLPSADTTAAAVGRGDQLATIDKRYLRADGTEVHVRIAGTIVRGLDQQPLMYLTVVTDLTELRAAQRRSEANERHLRRVITSAADAYVSLDPAGRVRDWSPAAVRMFGWSRADALGADLAELVIPPELRDAHRAGLARGARSGQARTLTVLGQRRDGHPVPLELRIWATDDTDGRSTFHAFLRDVTERAAALAEANRHALVFASIGDAVVLSGMDGLIVEVNPAGELLFDKSRKELIGAPTISLLDTDTPIDAREVRVTAATEGQWSADVEFTAGGRRRVSAAVVRPVVGPDGTPYGFLTVHRDVTEIRAAAAAVAAAEARYRLLAENSSDIISQIAPDGTVLYVSPSFERVFGKNPDHLIGGPVGGNAHPDDLEALHEAFATVLAGTPVRMQGRRQRVDGTWIWLETSSEPLLNPATGQVIGVQSAGRDITERKNAEAELERLALHDVLTGLANRALLADHLRQAQKRLSRERSHIALLMVDLDGFKPINDTHGHAAGDAVLVEVANRLRACARPTDTVARLGGDEFVVLLDGLTDPYQAELVALRILAALREPVTLPDGTTVEARASIGIAVSADPTQAPTDLDRIADTALYRAKRDGGDRASR